MTVEKSMMFRDAPAVVYIIIVLMGNVHACL